MDAEANRPSIFDDLLGACSLAKVPDVDDRGQDAERRPSGAQRSQKSWR
jgi:hypothetical protein